MSVLSQRTAWRLGARHPLIVDATRGRAIKRCVHELEVDIDAAAFAAALVAELRDPHAEYGLIDVKRAPSRVGHDFVVGERFHGCVRLARVAQRWRGSVGALLGALGRSRVGGWLEDELMSDYAEIAQLELSPRPGEPYRMVYRYLSGSPIAGTSTFTIEAIGASRCRFRAVFEFQEIGLLAITALHRFGLRMHDEVTHVQVQRAAARAGAHIIASTIRA